MGEESNSLQISQDTSLDKLRHEDHCNSPRQFDNKNAIRLLDVFRSEVCLQREHEHHVPALTHHIILDNAAIGGLSRKLNQLISERYLHRDTRLSGSCTDDRIHTLHSYSSGFSGGFLEQQHHLLADLMPENCCNGEEEEGEEGEEGEGGEEEEKKKKKKKKGSYYSKSVYAALARRAPPVSEKHPILIHLMQNPARVRIYYLSD